MTPAERKQLRGERRGPLASAPDLLRCPDRQLLRTGFKDETGVAENRREHIIEVMGDTACQSADCLHLLRLPTMLLCQAQRLLGAISLSDILDREQNHAEPIQPATAEHQGAAPHAPKV